MAGFYTGGQGCFLTVRIFGSLNLLGCGFVRGFFTAGIIYYFNTPPRRIILPFGVPNRSCGVLWTDTSNEEAEDEFSWQACQILNFWVSFNTILLSKISQIGTCRPFTSTFTLPILFSFAESRAKSFMVKGFRLMFLGKYYSVTT